MAVNNQSRNAAAKAEVETARSAGTLTKLASKVEQDKVNKSLTADGITFVVTPFLHDGRVRSGGAAIIAHPNGPDKPSAKSGWTGRIALAFAGIAEDAIEACENMDATYSLGAHAPVKDTTKDDTKSRMALKAAEAENNELRAAMAAQQAQLDAIMAKLAE